MKLFLREKQEPCMKILLVFDEVPVDLGMPAKTLFVTQTLGILVLCGTRNTFQSLMYLSGRGTNTNKHRIKINTFLGTLIRQGWQVV